MSDQPKIGRLLKLLLMLSGKRKYTLVELADRLEVSERTTYRYLETIKTSGIIVDLIDNMYSITKNYSVNNSIASLLYFSEEEAYILQKAIHSIDDNNFLKENLIKKLYALYDSDRIPYTKISKENSETIHKITLAIRNKKQVILRSYQSSHSSIIRDRLIEPFYFTLNYVAIWSFDPEDRKNKIFKTSRIKNVTLTDTSWQFEKDHHAGYLDVFRISSQKKIPVRLKLNLKSCNLLIEEYTLAENFITKVNDNEYLFDGWVCNFDGISRFILGLPDDIKVVSPKKLREYLNAKIVDKKF